MLGDFSTTTQRQVLLFEKPERASSKSMDAIDLVNSTVGTIQHAALVVTLIINKPHIMVTV